MHSSRPWMLGSLTWEVRTHGCMDTQYQVSSLTVVNGLHNLGYITTCLLCQFDFKSVFVVVEQLLLRHEHFYGTKRLIFCSLVTSSIHTSSFNCVTKKSCLLPFIIGY